MFLREYARDKAVQYYAKMPFDTDEFNKMATEILQDEKELNLLMKRLQQRIKERVDKIVPESIYDPSVVFKPSGMVVGDFANKAVEVSKLDSGDSAVAVDNVDEVNHPPQPSESNAVADAPATVQRSWHAPVAIGTVVLFAIAAAAMYMRSRGTRA
jgi:hypothetical protein